jgi:hypothetical protein
MRTWCRLRHCEVDSTEGRRALVAAIDLIQAKYDQGDLIAELSLRLDPPSEAPQMNQRQSFTQDERRRRFEETHDVATAIILAQRAARDEKTARLRKLREAKASEEHKARRRVRRRLTAELPQ